VARHGARNGMISFSGLDGDRHKLARSIKRIVVAASNSSGLDAQDFDMRKSSTFQGAGRTDQHSDQLP
jgi:hypothetical protein